MIIIWGTKYKRRPRGRVADACMTCGAASKFTLSEVRKVAHVYYIPLGSGTQVGFENTCERCGTVIACEPSSYSGIDTRQAASLDELIDSTNPRLRTWIASRKELEAKASAAVLTPVERKRLLAEPLMAVEPALRQRGAAANVDGRSGLGIAAMFLCWLPMAVLPSGGLIGEAGVYLTIAWLVGALGFTVHSMATDRRRWFQRTHQARLAARIETLNPTVNDVADVFAELRAAGYTLPKLVTAEALCAGGDVSQPRAPYR